MTWRIPLLAIALAGTPRVGGPVAAQGLDVVLYRTRRAAEATMVEGLFRVDDAILGTRGRCQYVVRLDVQDTTGTSLLSNSWEGHCPRTPDGGMAASLETFHFAVVPARYTVRVSVAPQDDPTAMKTATMQLRGLPTDARVSDLVLAKDVGMVDSTNTGKWAMQTGDIGVQVVSEVVADPDHPDVAYYLEVYPKAGEPMDGELSALVKRPDGRQLARIKLQDVKQVAVNQPLAGKFSLAGLAPGKYQLVAELRLQDTVISRTHDFRMASAAEMAAARAPAGPEFMANLSDEQLEEDFAPIVVWLRKQSDRDAYTSLTATGKRAFLGRFFANMAPSAEGESAVDVFLQRSRQVQSRYAERSGRGQQAGWQTDRGRIYMIRGEPTNQVQRVLPEDGGAPFEIWYYPISSGYVYLFADDTHLGNYRLIFSTDPDQPSLPNWSKIVRHSAVVEMQRFGVHVSDPGNGGSSTNGGRP